MFKFVGVPEINLSNVSSPDLEQLEKSIGDKSKSAKAVWNIRVCSYARII